MKATKKPVEIEFFTFEEVVEFGKKANPESIHGDRAWNFEFKGVNITHENDECYIIPTLEGNHNFTPKDVLIVGVKGELYPCKKDIFELTYDVENTARQGETFEDRLKKEFQDLLDKSWKLADVLYKEGKVNYAFVEKVGKEQAELLQLQQTSMNAYLFTLGIRLRKLGIDPETLILNAKH